MVQQKVFSRSNITALFIDKEVFNPAPGRDRFNRVAGLEYNHASADNRWQGKLYSHYSFTPTVGENPFATGLSLRLNDYRYQLSWNSYYIGEDFQAEVGVVPRHNVYRINPIAQLNFYPKSKIINRHSLGLSYEEYRKPGLGLTDQAIGLVGDVTFQNYATLTWQVAHTYTYLCSDFDPTRRSNTPLRRGTDYRYTNAQFSYKSDRRKKINTELRGTLGQNYNGTTTLIRLSARTGQSLLS